MDKVALVTGGSKGIGKAICLELASKGYNVIVNYNGSKEKALATANDCINLKVKAIAYQCDVSNMESCNKMFADVIAEFGRVDVIVNNAGITKDGLLLRMSEEDFSKVIDTNLKGVFNVTKNGAKIMMKARSGRIINISSVIGLIGNAGQSNYAASKAGIIGFTKSLAKEMASRGVTANAIAPGFIKTDMTDVLSDQFKEGILNQIPMKSFGEPSDVAKLVSFLASDDAKYITGQVINVDGGMVMI